MSVRWIICSAAISRSRNRSKNDIIQLDVGGDYVRCYGRFVQYVLPVGFWNTWIMESVLILVLLAKVLGTVLPILIIGLSSAFVVRIWLEVINQGRIVLRSFVIDIIELVARFNVQRDDRLKRDIQLVEAGYHLKMRRLELQARRLELLD